MRNGAALLHCGTKRQRDDTGDFTSILPCKGRVKANDAEDRISSLPEDIIANILSRLTLKEAMRTSILSSKWTLFWTRFYGCLDFDASLLIYKTRNRLVHKSIEVERLEFVDWVNRVLNSLQSPTIEGLRVLFDVKSKSDIDSWIRFAVSKRAKSLELDLTKAERSSSRFESYLFPSHLLCDSSFACLSSLRLTYVDVTEEILNSVLIHCPSLEVLQVIHAPNLIRFRVSDPSIKLKCLELTICYGLEDVEISVVNLVSFSFLGPRLDIRFKNVPHLVEVSLGGLYVIDAVCNFQKLSCCFPLLETLTLDVRSRRVSTEFPNHIPEFSNLKHFELGSEIYNDDYSLLPFTFMLKASPLLHKFTLKVVCSWMKPISKKLRKHLAEHPYPCLKIMVIKGFVGVPAEMEVLAHVFENAPALEKLVIDACLPRLLGTTAESTFRETDQKY
ncbi:hypothetical protein REPUB_Repub07fG0138700 [Reevesia pubescens]